ncbi:hypothetical protein G9A89_023409 [Geosiphon pyriformis]|nr:hypothetical protein G9A89_023409 [Geosiphon pyriformis]
MALFVIIELSIGSLFLFFSILQKQAVEASAIENRYSTRKTNSFESSFNERDDSNIFQYSLIDKNLGLKEEFIASEGSFIDLSKEQISQNPDELIKNALSSVESTQNQFKMISLNTIEDLIVKDTNDRDDIFSDTPLSISFEPDQTSKLDIPKELNQNDFILERLRFFAEISNTAYCEPSKIKFQVLATSPSQSSDEVIIAFGGLKSDLIDYIENNKTAQIRYPAFEEEKKYQQRVYLNSDKQLVNKAIYEIWASRQQSFFENIKEYLTIKNSGYRFVGHGLGGAFAVFAALSFLAHFPGRNIAVYTYGEPRIGNNEFAIYIAKLMGDQKLKVFRSTRTDDPIVHWPQWTKYYYDADQKRTFKCDTGLVGKENPIGRLNFKKESVPYFGVSMEKCLHFE